MVTIYIDDAKEEETFYIVYKWQIPMLLCIVATGLQLVELFAAADDF